MLTLGRTCGERIIVLDSSGQRILTIEVRSIQPGKVRLGFSADPTIKIWREELVVTSGDAEGDSIDVAKPDAGIAPKN